MSERTSPDVNADFKRRLEESIDRNLGVLNLMESHLGCAKCHGPLIESHCPLCQMQFFEMGNDGKLRHVR